MAGAMTLEELRLLRLVQNMLVHNYVDTHRRSARIATTINVCGCTTANQDGGLHLEKRKVVARTQCNAWVGAEVSFSSAKCSGRNHSAGSRAS